MLVSPLVVTLIAALVGAGVAAFLSQRRGMKLVMGALIGAVAGLLGTQVFMLPLNYCTFEAERRPYSLEFGWGLVAIGTGVLIVLGLWAVKSIMNTRGGIKAVVGADHIPGAFRGKLLPWLLLAPTLIIIVLFIYYPSIDTLRLSTLLARLGTERTAFMCVDNFVRLIGDPEYNQAFVNTIFLSIAIVVISMGLGLLVATAAHLPVKGASIYRTLLIWPYAVSPAVAGIIFLLLFNPTGGIINYGLQNLIGTSIPWLNNTAYAPWAVIIASVWKSLGFNILFYIAGLQNVPKDLIEAAGIDGANLLQRFWRIVWPLLSPFTFFLLITNTTYAFFETFGTIDYLTKGGPVRSTTTLMYEVYVLGFNDRDLGKAAAQTLILFVMVIGLTIVQFRTSERNVTYGA
jgi:sn-glycerol 3-phosphate transport system permease protein